MVFLTASMIYVFIVPPKLNTFSFTLLNMSPKLPKLETQSITTPTPSITKFIKSENIIDIVFAAVFTVSITLWFPISTSLNLNNIPTKAPIPVIRNALPNMFQLLAPFLAPSPDFSAPPPAPFTLFSMSSAVLPKSCKSLSKSFTFFCASFVSKFTSTFIFLAILFSLSL